MLWTMCSYYVQDLNIFSVQDVLSLVCLSCKILLVFFMKFCTLTSYRDNRSLGTQGKISSLNKEFPFTTFCNSLAASTPTLKMGQKNKSTRDLATHPC